MDNLWTYAWVAVTFLIYIGVAIWSKAGSTKEFYVAGGGVSPLANGMATAADWMSAASFLSMAGMISFSGYIGSQYLMGWTGGYVLLALMLAPYLRKFGKFTVPDFIGERYYSQTARVIAVICALFISFTYAVGQMKGVGIAFARFLEVKFETGVVIGIVIVMFYTVLGGMKGITYTQVAQYCVMIFAYLVPAIFISLLVTGNPVPQIGLGSKLADGAWLLDRLDQIHTDLGFKAYTSADVNRLDMFFVTAALMMGTAGLPHVIVRFFTVPRVRDARISAGYALVFIAILYTTAPAIAVFAKTNLISTIQETPYANVPEWFSNWEHTGLITFDDKNQDGNIDYYNDENPEYAAKAAAEGKRGNELTIDKDIMVLANPEIARLPGWVIGLVVAGGLAAALSTAAGLLLVISTSISHDLLKNWLRPNITEKMELRTARISIMVAVIVSGIAGINPPGFVAEVVAFAFGLAASSFFPAIVLGIFSTRVNMQGALSGMVAGILFTGGYIMYFAVLGLGGEDDYLWGISPTGIGTLGMLINLIVTVVVTYMTPAPPKPIQEMIQSIRIPRS
ncbi:MAG TPA: sodium:solute symporter family protein [Membranihabitans sp.]|nr:sodium:solute symporter family protein [Membranihabitans sp.]